MVPIDKQAMEAAGSLTPELEGARRTLSHELRAAEPDKTQPKHESSGGKPS